MQIHVHWVCGGGVVEHTVSESHLRAVEIHHGIQLRAARFWVIRQTSIEFHIAHALPIVVQLLDRQVACTVEVFAIVKQFDIGIYGSAHTWKRRNARKPFLQLHILHFEEDVFFRWIVGRLGMQCKTTFLILNHHVGIKHLAVVVEVKVIVGVHLPLAIRHNGFGGEQSGFDVFACECGVRTQSVTHLVVDIALFHQEIHNRILRAATHIHLCKVVPCARSVAHVQVESQVFVGEFVRMNGDGVDGCGAHTELVDITIEVDDAIVLHLALKVTNINIIARQIAWYQTTWTHFHLQREFGQQVLQCRHIERTGGNLPVNLSQTHINIFHKLIETTFRLEIEMCFLVINKCLNRVVVRHKPQFGVFAHQLGAVVVPVDVVQVGVKFAILRAHIVVNECCNFASAVQWEIGES